MNRRDFSALADSDSPHYERNMALHDLLRTCRTHFDQALEAAESALATQPQFREIARIEAKNVFHERVAGIFNEHFEAIVTSSGSVTEKLPRITSAFADQRSAYMAVFSDSANQEVCRVGSVNALQKAFNTVFA